MTRSWDEDEQWRMYCDERGCGTRSEQFPTQPPLELFAERGWFIAKKFGDVCPACLAKGVRSTVDAHSLMGGVR